MASKCTITFDNNPYGIYYAGQVISGTAELITTRPKTIRAICITVSGFAEVRWNESVTRTNHEGKSEKAVETYSASEMYYSSEKYVYGQSGGAQMELPAGKYVYPFQATIAPNAPTSFNGQHGQIQHEVSLVIERVMRYNNVFKQPFSVVSPFDLNLNPENIKPLQQEEQKIFCWGLCCTNNNPMIMKAFVPFSAYAPGQKIRFHIVLDNQSDVHCSDVKVRLMKVVKYTSRSPSTKQQLTEIKVSDNHCGEVVKLNKAEFNEFLQIPSTTPTSLESNCTIIKVSYILRFIAKVSRIYGDLIVDFPLTIGTVPLYPSLSDTGAGPVTAQPGTGPVFKPIPPPSYEEDIRSEQFEGNTFKPRYPTFLADAQLNGNQASVPIPGNPATSPSRNLYPQSPANMPIVPPSMPRHDSPHTPQNIPMVAPSMPRNDIPYPNVNPAHSPQPSAPPASAPLLHQQHKTSNKSADSSPLEVLGFSLPPDYEPTPVNKPKGGNVGWN